MFYIGLDVYKRTISYCVKDGSGQIHAEGAIPSTRVDLDEWMKTFGNLLVFFAPPRNGTADECG